MAGLKVADEVWVAVACLHREHPERQGFSPREILERAGRLHPGVACRPGLQPHIYQHCVATEEPSPARYRMLSRNPDRTLRLFRQGDGYHRKRKSGKTQPDRAALPQEHRSLVDWYMSEYDQPRGRRLEEDPILALAGVGKELWKSLGGGDAVIRWLRSDEILPPPWENASQDSEEPSSSQAKPNSVSTASGTD